MRGDLLGTSPGDQLAETSDRLDVGTVAPGFTLEDHTGNPVSVGDLADQTARGRVASLRKKLGLD